MIEHKSTELRDSNWREHMNWTEIAKHRGPESCLFRNTVYRIQGKIYKKNNKKFVKAFNQERVWEQLQK